MAALSNARFRRTFAFVLTLGGLLSFALVPRAIVFAQTAATTVAEGAADFNESLGLGTTSLATMIGNVIGAFLGLLGVVLVVLVIYAGFLWMTAQGDPAQITKAKQIITSAVIGLVIIMSAYAITAFILNAIFGATMGGGIFSGSGSNNTGVLTSSYRGRSALGNGIIDYHYPEANQTDVVRNTKIAVTLKKPIVLSTIIADYNDQGTYDLCDDTYAGANVCGADGKLRTDLNMNLRADNVRIVSADAMGEATGANLDAAFDARYPLAQSVTDAKVRFTEVAAVAAGFDSLERQTFVIKPVSPLGSATTDVNYRVALRGGESGIKIWDDGETGDSLPVQDLAFPQNYADGGYFWMFRTGTVIDTTPPQLVSLIPRTVTNHASSLLDRNQLLQAYFDEPIDPTLSIGSTSAGFNNIVVEARCSDEELCRAPFDTNNFVIVNGQFAIGNRYQTLEFVPDEACDDIAVNSCGDEVRCLPRGTEIRVTARAASVGAEMTVATEDNGIEDMAANSFDGNSDGIGQGPDFAAPYNVNTKPTPANTFGDSAVWHYAVGNNIDLVPPAIAELVPPPESADYPAGYNRVPSDLVIETTWTKVLSVNSIRTGGFDEATQEYKDPTATVILRSREWENTEATRGTQEACDHITLDPPSYYIESPLTTVVWGGEEIEVTKMRFKHPSRPFYKANDLGFTADDLDLCPEAAPVYAPIIRASIRDVKQNCFWPSYYRTESLSECVPGPDQESCCEKSTTTDGDAFLTNCAP